MACLLPIAADSCCLMLPAHCTCLEEVEPVGWPGAKVGLNLWQPGRVVLSYKFEVVDFAVHSGILRVQMGTKRHRPDGPPLVTRDLSWCSGMGGVLVDCLVVFPLCLCLCMGFQPVYLFLSFGCFAGALLF